ncbi:MoaD/ThiS family protein [Parasediminibacterium sp. JCM 36343]|uniref:MoaD/ThiS family protein n=1 Tax=Parasediminibacterium sp. JCM 36343 TaxID=3374279 RepID=UPI00397AD689
MSITIKAFGQVAPVTGAELTLQEALPDTHSLNQWLQQQYPALAGMKYALAVNKHLVNTNTVLQDGAVVALLPPFSGG